MRINNSREGKSIEQEVRMMLNNKEKISGESPLIYTPKSNGTMPAYDIRTDRFDIAVEGMDKIHKSYTARRDEKAKMEVVKEKDGGTESIQGTDN